VLLNEQKQPPSPPIDVQSLPTSYLSVDCDSIDAVMEGVRVMIAAEIAAEPSVRRVMRLAYRSVACISTRPTPKGRDVISPFHELFGLHMLNKKPLRDLFEAAGSDRHLYGRLMQAKAQGLIDVDIVVPTIETDNGTKADLELFLNKTDLVKLYLPDESDAWDDQRMFVLASAMERFLLPSLKEETHRELMRLSNEAIVDECAANFRQMLSVGPFRPSNVQPADLLRECPERPVYPSVATVWLPASSREPMFLAFTDKDGVLRAHDNLPSQAKHQKKAKLKEFFQLTRPDVIAINTGAGQVKVCSNFISQVN
jgi:transcription elongation factor SPT6